MQLLHWQDYNCSVDFVASPFLVRESSFTGRNGSFETLRLDLMDRTTSMYHDADVIVFNTGHWWTHEKTSKGCVFALLNCFPPCCANLALWY